MQTHVTIRDGISPELSRMIVALANRRPILQAMGQAIVSLSKQAFNTPSVRPAEWPARKKSYAWPILRKHGDLWQSIHQGKLTNDSVEVGSPKVYAAVHQFGSKKQKGRGSGIPARPYMPLIGSPDDARLTPQAETAIRNAAERQVRALLPALR